MMVSTMERCSNYYINEDYTLLMSFEPLNDHVINISALYVELVNEIDHIDFTFCFYMH